MIMIYHVLGEFVPGEDLEECDVEESAGSETLEDTNGEDMGARVLRLLVKGHDDPDEDADRSVEAQDDHVDDQLRLLDPAGQHVSPDTEDDGHSVDGDGAGQHPDPGGVSVEANGHALEQTVDREGDHHEDGPEAAEDVGPPVPLCPVFRRGRGRGVRVRVRGRAEAGLGDAVNVWHT